MAIDELISIVVGKAIRFHRELRAGSVVRPGKAHAKQLLPYRRLSRRQVGLLLNFSEATMKDGIRRLVNDYAGRA